MGRPTTRSIGLGQLEAGAPNIPKGHKQSLFRDVVRDASRCLVKKRKLVDEEGETQLELHPSPLKLQRDVTAVPTRVTTRNALAESKAVTLTAQLLGKRKRKDMGHNDIAIHEDTSATNAAHHLQPAEYEIMTRGNSNAQIYDDEDDSEDEIDETVAEDMYKLEENFKGISSKYRLINRIGEGMLALPVSCSLADMCRYIFHRLQSRATGPPG